MNDSFRCLCQVLTEEYELLHGPIHPTWRDELVAQWPHASVSRDEGSESDATCEPSLARLYALIHASDVPRSALCISGGGIRSATFGLGVIERLAERGWLSRFSYLSTVSGGGYVGSWLSAWIHRSSVAEVAAEIANRAGAATTKIDPEPQPVRHLRFYSNYLNPKLGLLSADTWTLGATYARNLVLNWLVILPLLGAVLMIPRLFVLLARHTRDEFQISEGLFVLGTVLAVLSLAAVSLNRPSGMGAHGTKASIFEVDQGIFLRWILVPLLLCAVCLTSAFAIYANTNGVEHLPALAVLVAYGSVVHLSGFLVRLAIRRPRDARVVILVGEAILVLSTGALAGVLLWLTILSTALSHPAEHPLAFTCLAIPAFMLSFLLAATVFVGAMTRWMDDEDREWLARFGAWILIPITVWLAGSALVLYGPQVVLSSFAAGVTAFAAAGATGVFTIIGGFSGKTAPSAGAGPNEKRSSPVLDLALRLAAPLFIALFLVGVVIATDLFVLALWRYVPVLATTSQARYWPDAWLLTQHHDVVRYGPFATVIVVAVALAAIGLAMGFFIGVNKFSLHAMYRARLIRAYPGASHRGRKPNPFTGFDPDDNVQMFELADRDSGGPFHVVNMALNLVSGENLAWQERKAISFTSSPLHSGSYCVGYRPSSEYGGPAGKGISLGTAVAISGAAASPNMGYHSSPVVTFLLTLFNVRLGWWLGNPGPCGDRTYADANPQFAILPIVEEAFGLTSKDRPYVYLSDGGHFENLALYEMILRRCRTIVLSDAGCDEKFAFEDLGNAVRKIRIDLGVPIEFPTLSISADAATSSHFAVGTIRYSLVDVVDGQPAPDGTIIYLKPSLCGDEPTDVRNYASSHRSFPHESTADQWFSESQFESYRVLGYVSAIPAVEALEAIGTISP